MEAETEALVELQLGGAVGRDLVRHGRLQPTALAGLRAARTTLQVLQERDAGLMTSSVPTHVRMSHLTSEQIGRRDN